MREGGEGHEREGAGMRWSARARGREDARGRAQAREGVGGCEREYGGARGSVREGRRDSEGG